MYNLFKSGIKYIVRAHKMKNDLVMVTTRQIKMLVNESKGFSLMIVKDYGFGNELVNIDTIQMLQDTPQVWHGGLEHENIFDCRKRSIIPYCFCKEKKYFIIFSICIFSFMYAFATI